MHESGNPNEYVPSDQSGDLGNEKNSNETSPNTNTNQTNANYDDSMDRTELSSSPSKINSHLNLGSRNDNNDSAGGGFQKRKYNSFDDTRRGNGRGGGGGFYKNSNYQGNKSFGGYSNKQQSFSRIPTINSQRNEGGQFNSNNNTGFSEHNRGSSRGGRGGGRYNNNRYWTIVYLCNSSHSTQSDLIV